MSTRPLYRILVVDDDREALFLVRELLGDASQINPIVDTATSPEEALAALSRGKYHLLFLDHNLGATTGLELFQAIRKEGYQQPAIMLSGFGNKDLAAKAKREGIEDYIDKKDLTTDLLERVVQLAARPSNLTPIPGIPKIPRVPVPGDETRVLLQEVIQLNKQFVHATVESTSELRGLRTDIQTMSTEVKRMNEQSFAHFKETEGLLAAQQNLVSEIKKLDRHWTIKGLDWIKDNKNVAIGIGVAIIIFALVAVIVSQTLNTQTIHQLVNPQKIEQGGGG